MMLYLFVACLTLIPTSVSKKTYQMVIPESTGHPHAKLLGTIDHTLSEFTLCHWSRLTKDGGLGCILIYSNETNLILYSRSRTGITHEQYGFYRRQLPWISISTGSNDTKWLHMCVTGSTFVNEKWRVFFNGVEVWTKKEDGKEAPIPPNGQLVLGQAWREYNNNFGSEKFQGQIADVFMWDRILTAQNVTAVYNCDNTDTANVINWNLHTWRLFDGVRVSYSDLPCGNK